MKLVTSYHVRVSCYQIIHTYLHRYVYVRRALYAAAYSFAAEGHILPLYLCKEALSSLRNAYMTVYSLFSFKTRIRSISKSTPLPGQFVICFIGAILPHLPHWLSHCVVVCSIYVTFKFEQMAGFISFFDGARSNIRRYCIHAL